jgi:2-dehydro-3-deoxyphosphogalactonate aldolase
MTLEDALKACGIIAILRGVTPDEVVEVSEALYEAGVRVVEVPLNSPEPFKSIELLAKAFAGRMIVGAGTVLSTQDVNMLKASGGQISVSPDCNCPASSHQPKHSQPSEPVPHISNYSPLK